MKKFLLSAALIAAFIIYSLQQRLEGVEESTQVILPARLNSLPNQPTAQTLTQNSLYGQHKNGVFTGDITDAYYGKVQVKVTITNNQITDVEFLQFPKDRRTSIDINTEAIPFLKQEAILAQSANVDTVSGATQTSAAFIKSLQSALDKAKS